MGAVSRWAWSAVLLPALVSCSGAEAEQQPRPQLQQPQLCDGSDGIRLAYSMNGGIAGFSWSPHSRFDPTFLAVDGQCNYWFGGNGSVEGIRGGTFSAEYASELSAELNYGRYASAASYRSRDVCFDGDLEFLSDGTGVLQSNCGSTDAPAVWSGAFERLYQLFSQVERESEPRWRPSRVLALRESQAPTSGSFAKWASVIDLDAHAVDLPNVYDRPDADSLSFLVEDPATLTLLEDLRSAALAADPFAVDLLVGDLQGRYYRLLVRDVVPDKVSRAIRDLRLTDETQ